MRTKGGGAREWLKTGLLGLEKGLRSRGWGRAAQCVAWPVRLHRESRAKRDAAERHRALEELRRSDRWTPFLMPYWDEKERGAVADAAANEALVKYSPEKFEDAMRERLGLPPGEAGLVAMGSGRAAIRLALEAMKDSPGWTDRDEVVLPSYACLGVLLPVIEAGLRPVFADVGSDLNLSAESVKEAVSERTLAVILAHLGGRRALDADRIRDLTRNAGAWLIDDQCQSLGGARDGRQWGLDSDFSVFSFGPGKTLTATAGGLLVARERRDRVEALAKEMPIGDYGEALARFEWLWQRHMVNRSGLDDPQTGAPESAFRQSFDLTRISPVDAALVLSQWEKMGAILSLQRGNAEALISLLDACQGMRVLGRSDENIWTKLTVQLDQAENRDGIIHWMRRSGIEPEPMYRPLHRREEAVGARRVPLARTEEVWRSVFNLPARPQLDPERMKMVAESLIRAMEKAKAGESHV